MPHGSTEAAQRRQRPTESAAKEIGESAERWDMVTNLVPPATDTFDNGGDGGGAGSGDGGGGGGGE